MVTEFPEVQGIMGRYYALNDGEVEEVAQAIADHYAPVGPSDFCPKAPISVTLALADKIDTLVGFWAIDEKPTGSKDPYALRRLALGVIRLILENKLRLSLRQLLAQTWAIAGYDKNKKDALDNLLSFFYDRLRVHLRDKGVRHDLITAVFNVSQESDIVQFLERIDVLENFLETDNGINLLSAYRRAVNILRIEEKKDKRKYDNESRIDKKLLSDEIEISLVEKLNVIIPKVKIALETEDIQHAMRLLASLRSLVDDFFDSVTVNSDDPLVRINRLLILSLMRSSFNQVADFSQIEGGER
jgi:glycyl-tRNA synthetase beta chain